MAERKKQGEMEKMLKKVEEGIVEFNELWDSVHNATHESQRDKFEAEMRTLMRKLQRDREQIKVLWQGDKAIRDKSLLAAAEAARKKIGLEMARFKEFERDSKTKAFSKEGLSKSGKLDPYEQDKLNHRQWIEDYIEKLNVVVEQLEADYLEAEKAKSKKAKKSQEAAHLKVLQDSHRWHVTKLEQLLRKLDNDELDMGQLAELKDGVQYYVDDQSAAPGEFQPWRDLYEEFHLDDVDDYLARDRARSGAESTPADADDDREKREAPSKDEEPEKAEGTPKAPSKSKLSAGAAPATSRAAARARGKDADAAEAAPAVAHKLWPPMMSVWQNPTPAPQTTPAPAASERETHPPPPPQVSKPAPPTGRTAPSPPPPAQPALERPPAHAPPNPPPPNQPPPKPAPSAPAMQPPAQAPPQPPLPAPPAARPPSAKQAPALAGGAPMPPPPAMAPPHPGGPPGLHPPSAPASAAAAAFAGPADGPPSASPPPPPPSPPPPPLLPPPAPVQPASMGEPPSSVLPQAASHKKPPVELGDWEPPAQRPPPAPFAPEERVAHMNHVPKHPPPTEAPPPPSESPPRPPTESRARPPVPEEPMALQAEDSSACSPVAVPVHRDRPRNAVPIAAPGAAAAAAAAAVADAVAPSVAAAQQGHSVFQQATMSSQAGIFTPAGPSSPRLDVASGFEATSPLSPRRLEVLEKLANSHRHLPLPSDGRRSRKYEPRNPYVHMDTRNTEAYPMQPGLGYDDPQKFEKYEIDTLFFIFYYQQGSYQQHLASKMLKNQSWRYHTKYLTWFQRKEEPRLTTADYERGMYVFFDHEGGWCERIKTDFTFEYSFLENDEQG